MNEKQVQSKQGCRFEDAKEQTRAKVEVEEEKRMKKFGDEEEDSKAQEKVDEMKEEEDEEEEEEDEEEEEEEDEEVEQEEEEAEKRMKMVQKEVLSKKVHSVNWSQHLHLERVVFLSSIHRKSSISFSIMNRFEFECFSED